ncbi:terpenoid synthase [Phanerochaete sordida]|uniref:Terpenoid synthase n=1 Tax=Phanerochaete sordida TaxID=48140 RepID=A0A9P3GIE1_9APHY|nr:terpenoid synthase [Phanerochaete sordida]
MLSVSNVTTPWAHGQQPESEAIASNSDIAKSHDTIPDEEESLVDFARRMTKELLDKSGVTLVTDTPAQYHALDARTRAEAATWDLTGHAPEHVEKTLHCSVMYTAWSYPHGHLDAQLVIACIVFWILCIDDYTVPVAALSAFAPRLQTGAKQLHPGLDVLAALLARTRAVLNPYAATACTVDVLNYVNSTLHEHHLADMPLARAARRYPLYKRTRNGINEICAGFVWDAFTFPDVATHIQAFPDAILFIALTNDVLTFYKEELAGDTRNFVHDEARVTGRSPRAVVAGTVDAVVDTIRAGRAVLSGAERDAWDSFVAGYISFSVLTPRYRVAGLAERGVGEL